MFGIFKSKEKTPPIIYPWTLSVISDNGNKRTEISIPDKDIHMLAEILAEALTAKGVEVTKTVTYENKKNNEQKNK